MLGARRDREPTRYQKPIEEKESWKWLEGYQAVSAVQRRCRRTRLVLMSDRESDIHELFAEQAQTPKGAQLLIRAERSRNRKVQDEDEHCDFLWPLLEKQELVGTREILVPPSEKRAARQATLAGEDPAGRSAHTQEKEKSARCARLSDPRAGDGLVEETALGAEVPEQGDLAHPRGLGDSPSGRAPESDLGEDRYGGLQYLVADVHGEKTTRDLCC